MSKKEKTRYKWKGFIDYLVKEDSEEMFCSEASDTLYMWMLIRNFR